MDYLIFCGGRNYGFYSCSKCKRSYLLEYDFKYQCRHCTDEYLKPVSIKEFCLSFLDKQIVCLNCGAVIIKPNSEKKICSVCNSGMLFELKELFA